MFHKGPQTGKAASSSRKVFHAFLQCCRFIGPATLQLPLEASAEFPSLGSHSDSPGPCCLVDNILKTTFPAIDPRTQCAASLLKALCRGQGPFCPGAAQAARVLGRDWEPPHTDRLTGQWQLTVCPLNVTAPCTDTVPTAPA